jgi:hypothetical protein
VDTNSSGEINKHDRKMAHTNDEGSNLVQELTKDDILLGRGTGPNEYQGNIRFRALVKATLRSNEFNASTGSTKTMLARKIVHAVKAQNGRFLKKVGKSSTGGDLFAVVPDRVAVDKTRQSFRHQLKSTRKPKTPAGGGEEEDCLLHSSRESSGKFSSAKSVRSPLLSAFDVRKEDQAKSISTLTAGSTSSGLLSSLLPQQAKITTGMMDSGGSSASSEKQRSDFLERAGHLYPTSSGATDTVMSALFEANMKQRVARYNQQYLPRLSFPSCLGRDESYLAGQVPFSSRNGALDRLRFELDSLKQAARDQAYMENLNLLRRMKAQY